MTFLYDMDLRLILLRLDYLMKASSLLQLSAKLTCQNCLSILSVKLFISVKASMILFLNYFF